MRGSRFAVVRAQRQQPEPAPHRSGHPTVHQRRAEQSEHRVRDGVDDVEVVVVRAVQHGLTHLRRREQGSRVAHLDAEALEQRVHRLRVDDAQPPPAQDVERDQELGAGRSHRRVPGDESARTPHRPAVRERHRQRRELLAHA